MIASILWIIALIVPNSKIFKKFPSRFKGRKGLSKILLSISVVAFIGAMIASPPITAELKSINLEPDQEVITEQYEIKGELTGSYASFKINGENIDLENENFSKVIELEPGDNSIEVVVTAEDEEQQEVEIHNKSYNVYFDYEGMLYAQELKKDKQAEKELQRKLAKVPKYEAVRKEDIENGFSSIIYIEGDLEDYLISNVIKDLKAKNPDISTISALIFSKSDKKKVESVLETTDIGDIIPYVRGNYEKRPDKEQLFWFPDGANGTKLALEL